MHILVTGAAGFIGSHTCQALLRRGDSVVGLDNFEAFYARSIKERNLAHVRATPGSERFSFLEADLCQQADIERAFDLGPFDVVVHLAARAGVRPSIDDPAGYVRSNVEATALVLQACRARAIGRVVFASSSSVYGADSTPPFAEVARADRPVSPYAATKRAAELLCHTYSHLYCMDITCLRFFTVYGPRQRPEMAIHKFATLLVRGQRIPIFGDGGSSRDYTFIDDILQGVLAAIDRPKGFAVYNLGGDHETRLCDLIDLLGQALGQTPRLEWLPVAPGDVPMTSADLTLAQRDLGYAPRVPMAEGVRRFAEWFQEFGVK